MHEKNILVVKVVHIGIGRNGRSAQDGGNDVLATFTWPERLGVLAPTPYSSSLPSLLYEIVRLPHFRSFHSLTSCFPSSSTLPCTLINSLQHVFSPPRLHCLNCSYSCRWFPWVSSPFLLLLCCFFFFFFLSDLIDLTLF